jgi:hypothetical protein
MGIWLFRMARDSGLNWLMIWRSGFRISRGLGLGRLRGERYWSNRYMKKGLLVTKALPAAWKMIQSVSFPVFS